jgi:ribosomal protein L9
MSRLLVRTLNCFSAQTCSATSPFAALPTAFQTQTRGYNRNRRWVQVILQEDQELGQKHTLATFRPGYARSFLVPQGKAIYATVENKIEYNLLESKETPDKEEVVLQDDVRAMDNFVHKYVQRLSFCKLDYIRNPAGKGIHKPVTGDHIVSSLTKKFQFPGICAEQIIFPDNQPELSAMGEFAVKVNLTQNSLLPGVGLSKEFEDRDVQPVTMMVKVRPAKEEVLQQEQDV